MAGFKKNNTETSISKAIPVISRIDTSKNVYTNSLVAGLNSGVAALEDIDLLATEDPNYKMYIASATSFNQLITNINNSKQHDNLKEYLSEIGIDLDKIDEYSYNDLLEKGFLDEKGYITLNADTINKLEGSIENPHELVAFASMQTLYTSPQLRDTSFKELKNQALHNDNGYFPNTNTSTKPRATAETYKLIDTIVEFEKTLSPLEAEVFNEYIKDKPLSELFDENGKLIINRDEILRLFTEKTPPVLVGVFDIGLNNKGETIYELYTDGLLEKTSTVTVPKISDEHLNSTFNDVFSEDKDYDHMSDYDKININALSLYLTNDLKTRFGEDSLQYKVICEYLKGKKIGDIINDDGTLKINIDDIREAELYYNEDKETMETLTDDEILEILNTFSQVGLNTYTNNGTISEDLKSLTIEEIVTDENGYDAVVFQKNGKYIITNSCTNSTADHQEDVAAIAYSSLFLLCDNEDSARELYELIIKPASNLNYSFDEAKEIYYAQIEAGNSLIEKYASKGEIALNGYSLGGGTMFNSYVEFVSKHPELADNVQLDLYNPYLNYFQANSKYGSLEDHQKLIEEIVAKYGDNIHIRCNEGDVVSQFNNITESFGDSIEYIKSKPGYDYEMNKFGGIIGIADLIVSDESRHSLQSFDEGEAFGYGYLKKGEQITLNEIAKGEKGTYQSNDLKDLINDGLSDYLEEIKASAGEYEPLIDALISYLKDNAGNIDYDDLVEVLSPSIVKITMDKAAEMNWFANISNFLMNTDVFKDKVNEYFTSEEGRKKLKEVIGLFMQGGEYEEEAKNILYDTLTNLYLSSLISTYINEPTPPPKPRATGPIRPVFPIGQNRFN